MVMNKSERSKYNKKYQKEHKDKLQKQGKKYRDEHKDEKRKYNKKWRDKNKDERREYVKNYCQRPEVKKRDRERGKDPKRIAWIKQYNKKYQEEHREEIDKKSKNRREKNKKEIAIQKKKWYEDNKKEIKERRKNRYQNNKKEIKEKRRDYYQKNKEKFKEYYREKYKNDPQFRLSRSISVSIWESLHGQKENRHWETLVDYNQPELKSHLENQFKSGMNWKNYGNDGWHNDHIIPQSYFIFEKYDDIEFKWCWSLDNLQPLSSDLNERKWERLVIEDVINNKSVMKILIKLLRHRDTSLKVRSDEYIKNYLREILDQNNFNYVESYEKLR